MKHLFVCREYPPAPYLAGGIGTYVRHLSEVLAAAGETVHVIAQRWPGAPRLKQVSVQGRLTVHRVALDEPIADPWAGPDAASPGVLQRTLIDSAFPSQAFAWQVALLAERLVELEGIDVIEAQEWEAPLVFLQQRRAQGLGPARRPPCVVHLHSSTEAIFKANGWNTAVADYAPAVALEACSIRAADALLAPSVFIAEETAARHGLARERITIIPYPLGAKPAIERPAASWQGATICHLGRLELRKGVLEWARAVAEVGREKPLLRAEFAGGDTPLSVTGGGSVRALMRQGLARVQRRQLRFHGQLDAAGMGRVLRRSFAAVVPSRWENFPNTCIEAMQSGLPVIVSPHGGMVELVQDGVTGWVAGDSTPAALAQALRRALATPVEQRQCMGAAAAAAVRQRCDPGAVLRQHLAFKAALAAPPVGIAAAAVLGLHTVPAARCLSASAMSLAVRRPYLSPLQGLVQVPPEQRRRLPLLVLQGLVRRLAVPTEPVLAPVADPLPAPFQHSDYPQAEVAGLVSVVVAAYNAEATLTETLLSVLHQTWRDFELIVVDDGSSDGTAACVRTLAARDARVRLICQRNRGVGAARNRGLLEARGEFVAPLDADDLWAPTKLQRQLERLRSSPPDTAMVYCWWSWIDSQGRLLDRAPRWRVEGRVLDRLAEVNFVGNASVPMFRRAVVLRLGGYDSRLRDLAAQGCEDWDLALKVAEHHRVAVVSEVLVGYRRQASSMSSGCLAMWYSGCRVLDELAARQPKLPVACVRAGRGQFALHLAGVAFWSGRVLEACAWAVRSRAWTTLLAIAPSVLTLALRRRLPGALRAAVQGADCYDAARLPEPLMPYERILVRRWARRDAAASAVARAPS